MSTNRLVKTIYNVKYNYTIINIIRYIKMNVPRVCTYFGGSCHIDGMKVSW